MRLDHRIEGPSGLVVIEKQDIVYRDAAAPRATSPAGTPAPAKAHFTSGCRADPDAAVLDLEDALPADGKSAACDQVANCAQRLTAS